MSIAGDLPISARRISSPVPLANTAIVEPGLLRDWAMTTQHKVQPVPRQESQCQLEQPFLQPLAATSFSSALPYSVRNARGHAVTFWGDADLIFARISRALPAALKLLH